MVKELELKLKKGFPKLYSEGSLFSCQDGWFAIIWRLSNELNKLPAENVSMRSAYNKLKVEFESDNDNWWQIIKLVGRFESESLSTCEICGEEKETAQKEYCVECLDKVGSTDYNKNIRKKLDGMGL